MSESIALHSIPIRDAAFPKPFPGGLQYSCPVHTQWNIVHIGSLLPESHAIYVCGDNCLRGVVMTAAEMGLSPHFSAVMPDEQEMADGRLEEVTIRGTAELIRKLPTRPKAVLLFLVCMHHFVGADARYIFRELEKQFPDICFLRCWMDPVMQKLGPSPDMKLRREMLSPLKNQPRRNKTVSFVSDNLPLSEESDLCRLLRMLQIPYRQPQDMQCFSAYQSLGEAALFITRSPAAAFGLRKFAEEERRPWLCLPPKLCYHEIRAALEKLLQTLQDRKMPDTPNVESQRKEMQAFCEEEERRCEAAFEALSPAVRAAEISLDGIGLVQPLSCARLLLSHGLHVRRIYLDAFLPEEKDDFLWLKQHAPDLQLHPVGTVEAHAQMKCLRTAPEQGVPAPLRLALGPVAALFEDSRHFIDQIENRGAWGYQAVRQLLQDMETAAQSEKPTETLVQQKGLGLPSLVEPLPC